MDGIRWLFAPVVAWWSFAATLPQLVHLTLLVVIICALGYLLLQFLRLIFRR